MIKSDITDFWKIFEEPIGFRLFPAIKSQNVSLGYDQNGHKSIFIDLPLGIYIAEPKYNLEHLLFRIEKVGHKQIIVSLRDESFSTLFDEFLYAIFSQINEMSSIEKVGKKIVELYHEWSLFFIKENRKQIRLQRILGLAGELYYIDQYLNQLDISVDIIQSWEGPSNRTHDFIFMEYDLEVKSKLLSSNTIHISSLFQLEFDKILRLGVVSFSIWSKGQEDPSFTISMMVDSILVKLRNTGRDNNMFLNKLLQAGINYYDKEQMEEVDALRFAIHGHQEYDASNDDFPRLITSNIPVAIKKIKYDMDLNLIEEFKI